MVVQRPRRSIPEGYGDFKIIAGVERLLEVGNGREEGLVVLSRVVVLSSRDEDPQ